jgi:hypothetical protein
MGTPQETGYVDSRHLCSPSSVLIKKKVKLIEKYSDPLLSIAMKYGGYTKVILNLAKQASSNTDL